jgi:transposase
MDAASTDPQAPLPDDVPTLQRLVRELLGEVGRLRQENAALQARLDGLLRWRFGPRSERTRTPPPTTTPETPAATDAAGHGRQALPAHLPRQRVEYDLTEAEQLCPCCGRPRACIGAQVSEQLDYQPASYFVLQHVKKTYACRDCDGPAGQRLTTAGPAVVGPIPKGLPGPGLLAHLVVSKYGDHLPLYRLEGIVARSGVSLARSTLADWMAQAAALLRPLVDLMRAEVLRSRGVHSDDTPVPFQRPGQERTATGHLWVYLGDRDHPYAVFDFTPTYSRDGPEAVLAGYEGYLQADALAQYEGLYATGKVRHVACWAHARRKFVEAEKEDPVRARQALDRIGQLYAVERRLAEQFEPDDDAGRQGYRRAQAGPLLEGLRGWLEEQQRQVLPKGQLGQAVGYALRHWAALTRYLEEGYLAIDNNAAERALRQVAVGRKNWLFCGSEEGGQTAAVLFSVVGTCKRLGVDPFAYLREALPGLFALGEGAGAAALADWLPDAWQKRQARGAAGPAEAEAAAPEVPAT